MTVFRSQTKPSMTIQSVVGRKVDKKKLPFYTTPLHMSEVLNSHIEKRPLRAGTMIRVGGVADKDNVCLSPIFLPNFSTRILARQIQLMRIFYV